MAAIYLIRHGQASFGQANYDALSPLGKRQSQVLGESLLKRNIQFDRIIHGGLVRHDQTATHCLTGMEIQAYSNLEVDKRFSEYNHLEVIARLRPDLESHQAMAEYLAQSGEPRKAFQKLFATAIQRWQSGDFDHEYSESWKDFQNRCANGLQDLISNDQYKDTAVFTSGGPISMSLQQVLNLNDQQAINLSWSLVNGSVTKLLFKNGKVSLSYFNDYGYFELVDPTLVTYR